MSNNQPNASIQSVVFISGSVIQSKVTYIQAEGRGRCMLETAVGGKTDRVRVGRKMNGDHRPGL